MISKGVYVSEANTAKKRQARFLKVSIGIFILALLIVIAGWVVIRSPFFQVGSITILGSKEVPEGDIRAISESAVFGRSWFGKLAGFSNMLNWPKEFSRADISSIPKLRAVTVKKDYRTKSIVLQAQEREPYGVWCFSEKGKECFWFDVEGVIFKRSLSVEGNIIRVVNDYSSSSPSLGGPIMPSVLIPNLRSVFGVLQSSGISVSEIRFEDPDLQEVAVSTNDGPSLLFSLRFPSDYARSVIAELTSRDIFKRLSYIDFRSENRAYYK